MYDLVIILCPLSFTVDNGLNPISINLFFIVYASTFASIYTVLLFKLILKWPVIISDGVDNILTLVVTFLPVMAFNPFIMMNGF